MAKEDKEIVLLKVSGQDKPGVTAGLTAVLANYNAIVLDIGQADIHETLSLGILFEIEAGSSSGPVLKDLLFKGYELGIKVKFVPISIDDYESWVKTQSKQRYIINIMGHTFAAKQIAAVTKVMSDQNLNIDTIKRLTSRASVVIQEENPRSCVQLSVSGIMQNKALMTASFMEISRFMDVDISFQEDNIYRRNRRLVCFDMDSTLIQAEVIDKLAELAGVGDEVKAKVLLSYGNATQKNSPHNGDQLELFSKKEMRDAWCTKAAVDSNTKRVEVLNGDGFSERE